MPIGDDWSPQDIENLKKWWADGKTAGEIVELFGHSRTRNAIAGKVHRLKLPTRPQDAAYQNGGRFSAKTTKIAPPADRRKANPSFVSSGAKLRIEAARTGQKQRKIAPPMAGNQRSKAFILGEGPPALEEEPLPIRSEVWRALPGTHPVALTDRTGCHWPIGDGAPFLMCNEQISDGVYCATHNRIGRSAYNVRR